MDMAEAQSRRHPLYFPAALALAGVAAFLGLCHGAQFIDDAFITMRYAEKLATGHGFVFNSEPVLGTTAPLYCLLLAALRTVGLPMLPTAFGIGIFFSAAAVLLCAWGGFALKRPAAGLWAGLILVVLPTWWANSKTGMETTMAAALALAVILAALKGRPAWSGFLSALLCMTRPDAALLPVIVFSGLALRDRRRALRFALAGIVGLLPWIVYAFVTFGSPLPQSLAAKRIIHDTPWLESLTAYFRWHVATTGASGPRGMLLIAALWVAGVISLTRSRRQGLALVLWPPVFLLGLSLIRAWPQFFWYRVPILPAYFLVAGCGLQWICAYRSRRASRLLLRASGAAAIGIFLLFQAQHTAALIANPAALESTTARERVLEQMAEAVKTRTRQLGLDPVKVKVFVGEVGVMGYELIEFEVIDSAGINSREVYELRKEDRQALGAKHPDWPPQRLNEGTARWSIEVVNLHKPRFIASDVSFLHLRSLSKSAAFREAYQPLQSWRDPIGRQYVLLERTDEAGMIPLD